MNRKILIGLAPVLILVAVVLLLPYISQGTINPVDRSCSSDSDCVLRDTGCIRDCGSVAVNKNWNRFCPFGEIGSQPLCKPTLPSCVVCVGSRCRARGPENGTVWGRTNSLYHGGNISLEEASEILGLSESCLEQIL